MDLKQILIIGLILALCVPGPLVRAQNNFEGNTNNYEPAPAGNDIYTDSNTDYPGLNADIGPALPDYSGNYNYPADPNFNYAAPVAAQANSFASTPNFVPDVSNPAGVNPVNPWIINYTSSALTPASDSIVSASHLLAQTSGGLQGQQSRPGYDRPFYDWDRKPVAEREAFLEQEMKKLADNSLKKIREDGPKDLRKMLEDFERRGGKFKVQGNAWYRAAYIKTPEGERIAVNNQQWQDLVTGRMREKASRDSEAELLQSIIHELIHATPTHPLTAVGTDTSKMTREEAAAYNQQHQTLFNNEARNLVEQTIGKIIRENQSGVYVDEESFVQKVD